MSNSRLKYFLFEVCLNQIHTVTPAALIGVLYSEKVSVVFILIDIYIFYHSVLNLSWHYKACNWGSALQLNRRGGYLNWGDKGKINGSVSGSVASHQKY